MARSSNSKSGDSRNKGKTRKTGGASGGVGVGAPTTAAAMFTGTAGGGASVGLNPLMPAQDQLSDEELGNLIAFIHSLKK